MMYVWCFFSGVVLAALALDALLSFTWSENPKTRKRLIAFAAATTGLLGLYAATDASLAHMLLGSSTDAFSPLSDRLNALELHLPALQAGGAIIFFICIALFTVLFLAARSKISRRLALIGIMMLVIIDLVRISGPFLSHAIKPKDFYARQEAWEQSIGRYISSRDSTLYRVYSLFGDQRFCLPGLNMTYVFDDFADMRYNNIIQLLNAIAYTVYQVGSPDSTALKRRLSNLLSFLNTKYLLTMGDPGLPGFSEILNADGFRILKNEKCLPRIYLADSIVVAGNPFSSLVSSLDGPAFPRRLALLDNASWGARTLDTATDTTVRDSIAIARMDYRNGYIQATVASNKVQMLIIGENNAPGWKAKINGTRADIISVNYLWKGVVIPRGKLLTVELFYNSPSAGKWRNVTLWSAIFFVLFIIAIPYLESLFGIRKPGHVTA
jgi:uncharacterized membrane protein YfhO